MSIKDKRFTARPKEERVNVPEFEADVIVRGMTAAERFRFSELGQKNGSHAEAYAITACVLDPETGKPVYEEADRDELLRLDCDFLDRFGKVILRLSGFSRQAIADAEKNSSQASGD